MLWSRYENGGVLLSVSRSELMDRYCEDWGCGDGNGEGWVAYGSALVRDGVLRDLRCNICRVLGVSLFEGECRP